MFKKYFNIKLLSLVMAASFLVSSVGFPQTSVEVMRKSIANAQSGGGVRSFSEHNSDSDNFNDLPVSASGAGDPSSFYYSVHVLGLVKRPGIYRVLPSDRLTDALKYAGDLLPNATETRIQLRRNGSGQIINLFDYKFKGDLKDNPYLVENDVIFVPPKKGEIDIEGPVARPGFYEIDSSISLKACIEMAGGFTVGNAVNDPIRIIRYHQDGQKELLEISETEKNMQEAKVEKGDAVIIPHILLSKTKFDYAMQRIPGDNIFYPTINDSVYVIGSVAQPGPVKFQPGFDMQSYVSLAGATQMANLNNLQVINQEGKRFKPKKHAQINPGDTILVPERAVTFTKSMALFNTLTSSALTSFFLYDRLKN